MEEEEYDEPKLPRDAQMASEIFWRESVDGILDRGIGTFQALNAIRKMFPAIPPTCSVGDLLFMIDSVATEGDFIEETFITFFIECLNIVRQEFGVDGEEEEDDEESFALTDEFIADRLSDLQPVDEAHLTFNFASFLINSAEIVKLDAIQNFPSLINVSLKTNLIRDLTPLTKLPKLRTLDLTENKVSNIGGLVFPALEKLILASNELVCLDGLVAPKLRILDVSSNKIFFIGPYALARSPALETLNITQNNIRQFREQCFAGLAKLKTLKLAENGFSTLSGALPKEMTELKELDMSDTQVISLTGLEGLTSLEVLDLRRTGIEQVEEFAEIRGISPLKRVFIEEAPVAELEQVKLELIHMFPTLEELDEDPVTFADKQDAEQMIAERLEEEQRMLEEQFGLIGGEEEEVVPLYEEKDDNENTGGMF